MQTDVPDVSGAQSSMPSIVNKIIEIIKDDMSEILEVVRETEKMSKI
jgi:hypothetical protein